MQTLTGEGRVVVPAPPAAVWAALLDPDVLVALIPGAERVQRLDDDLFRAVLSLGVGPLRSRYGCELRLSAMEPPRALRLRGHSEGAFGWGHATGEVTLEESEPGRTLLAWRYEGEVFGPVALAGGTLLGIASRLFVNRFFAALVRWPFDGPAPDGQHRSDKPARRRQ